MRKNKLLVILICVALLVTTSMNLFAGGAQEAKDEKIDLIFFSGPLGGAWYPLAGAAAEIIQKAIPGVNVEVQPGAGLVNMEAIQAGKAHLGMGNSPSTADGYAGRAPFTKPTTKVRNLMSLYNLVLHIVGPTDSNIRSIYDFRGKRVSAQTAGETGEVMLRDVLSAYGMSYADLAMVHHLSHGDSANLVRDRHADIMASSMNVPGPAIMELTMSRPMRLVSIDEDKFEAIRAINAGYSRFVIPAGSYPGQDEDVLGVGMVSHFAISSDLDDDLVYKITEALYNNIDKLKAVVNTIETDVNFLTTEAGAPMHPGAQKFYDTIKK